MVKYLVLISIFLGHFSFSQVDLLELGYEKGKKDYLPNKERIERYFLKEESLTKWHVFYYNSRNKLTSQRILIENNQKQNKWVCVLDSLGDTTRKTVYSYHPNNEFKTYLAYQYDTNQISHIDFKRYNDKGHIIASGIYAPWLQTNGYSEFDIDAYGKVMSTTLYDAAGNAYQNQIEDEVGFLNVPYLNKYPPSNRNELHADVENVNWVHKKRNYSFSYEPSICIGHLDIKDHEKRLKYAIWERDTLVKEIITGDKKKSERKLFLYLTNKEEVLIAKTKKKKFFKGYKTTYYLVDNAEHKSQKISLQEFDALQKKEEDAFNYFIDQKFNAYPPVINLFIKD